MGGVVWGLRTNPRSKQKQASIRGGASTLIGLVVLHTRWKNKYLPQQFDHNSENVLQEKETTLQSEAYKKL